MNHFLRLFSIWIATLLIGICNPLPTHAAKHLMERGERQIHTAFTDPITGQERVDTYVVRYRGWIEDEPWTTEGCPERIDSWVERIVLRHHPLTGENAIESRYSRTIATAEPGSRLDVVPELGQSSCMMTTSELVEVARGRLHDLFGSITEDDAEELVLKLRDDMAIGDVRLAETKD